jgi:hypothetical protein
MKSIRLTFCCIVLTCGSIAHAANTFISFDSGPAKTPLQATALSGDGGTVVGATIIPSAAPEVIDRIEAFSWAATQGIQPLRPQPPHPFFHTIAHGVSYDGQVIVGNRFDPRAVQEAFRWTASGGLVGLGFPSPAHVGDFDSSSAQVISADGETVFGDSSSSSPFRWTAGDGMSPFPLGVQAMSADGSVLVGTRITIGFNSEAFRWTETTGAIGLGDLPGGDNQSLGMAVSANGEVVVGQSAGPESSEAFRWTSQGGIHSLGDMPGGDVDSRATAVSPLGEIAFGTSQTQSGQVAFVWDAVHGMRDFRQVLSNDYGLQDELVGWHLENVVGISFDGRTVAGNGTNPAGHSEAWIVRFDRPIGVPEPTAFAWAIAIAFLVPCCRRKSSSNHLFARSRPSFPAPKTYRRN